MPSKTTAGSLALLFLTCLCAYLLFWSGRHYSIDGIVMWESAKPLLFQGSFQIDPPIFWAGEEIRVSTWSLGQTLAYQPVLFALSRLFPDNALYRQIPNDPHNPYYPLLLENTPYHYASLLHPLVTSLTAVLVYVLGRKLGLSRKGAWAAGLVFGLASPAAAYAKYDFAQPLVSLCLLAVVLAFLHSRDHDQRRWLSLCGFLLGLAILVRPEMIVIGGLPLAAAVIWDLARPGAPEKVSGSGRLARLLWFAIPLGACLLFLLAANELRYGSPFRTGFSSGDFSFDPGAILTGLVGTVAGPVRGLLFFFPLSLLALPGLRELLRRERVAGLLTGGLVLLSILLYASWGDWGGGRSWGPRFLVPILPYLSVLALLGYQALRPRWGAGAAALFGVLLFLSWLAALQGQLFDSMTYADRENMLAFSSSPLFTGWVGVAALDIFWVKKLAAGQPMWTLIPAFLLLILGACAWGWVWLFRQGEPP